MPIICEPVPAAAPVAAVAGFRHPHPLPAPRHAACRARERHSRVFHKDATACSCDAPTGVPGISEVSACRYSMAPHCSAWGSAMVHLHAKSLPVGGISSAEGCRGPADHARRCQLVLEGEDAAGAVGRRRADGHAAAQVPERAPPVHRPALPCRMCRNVQDELLQALLSNLQGKGHLQAPCAVG